MYAIRVLVPGVVLFAVSAGVLGAEPRHVALPGLETPWIFHASEEGAAAADTWAVEGDILKSTGTPLGYLRTAEDYGDFVLTFQWRWPIGAEPGKGGLLLRMTGEDKIWPKSLEAQINAGAAGDFWGLDGYSLSGPAERLVKLDHPRFGKLTNLKIEQAVERKPGKWNDYRIEAQGPVVRLWVNGQLVNEAVDCETTPGKLVLTSEGTPIEFRRFTLTVAAE